MNGLLKFLRKERSLGFLELKDHINRSQFSDQIAHLSSKVEWKWKWSEKCLKNKISLFLCISTTNNVKSCKKFNETAQTANFTDFPLSGLKNHRIKNYHIFGISRTSAFIWHIWIPLKNFCKRTRCVCVCIVLVHFGRYSQEDNGKSVKLAVWAVSLNFLHDFTLFVVDIHQIRLISFFRHFSDHFHFHPILEQKRVIDLIPCIYTNIRPPIP